MNISKHKFLLPFTILLFGYMQAQTPTPNTKITNGVPWHDTKGNKIEAHGGGILLHNGIYYWYGENKSLGHGNKVGVSCYASKDLLNWENIGVVFKKDSLPTPFQDHGVCERPKVIYNEKTKKFVMWMHLDAIDYTEASAGIAVSDSPQGPFTLVKITRPIQFSYDYPTGPRAEIMNEKQRGNTFRDMALFKDTDGKAYIFYSSEDNTTMYVSQLNDDFTDIVKPYELGKTWNRIFVNGNREAPAPFTYKNKYYIITSGLTGWAPNAAQYAVASHPLGPYEVKDNPCRGFESELTFRSQSTFVLPAPTGKPNHFIYMGDRWLGDDITNSTYIWLPFYISENDEFTLEYYPTWDFSIFNAVKVKKTPASNLKIVLKNQTPYLTWQAPGHALRYSIYKNKVLQGVTNQTELEIDYEIAEKSAHYTVIANYGFGKDAPASAPLNYTFPLMPLTPLTKVVPDSYSQGWGILMRNKNMDGGSIKVADITYPVGLGTHAHSEITYIISGKYTRFTAKVAKSNVPQDGKIVFKVLGDDKVLFESKPMNVGLPPKNVDVNISGVKTLKLVVEDGNDTTPYDHAVWLEPILYR